MEAEKIEVTIVTKVGDSVQNLQKVEKAAKETKESFDELKEGGEASGSALVSSFRSLAATFGLMLSAGAVVSFIKRMQETNLQVARLSERSGTAQKSVRALQNQFKALGYSSQQADAYVGDLTTSIANLRYNGQLGGIAQAFANIGISVLDANGKARDSFDLLIEAGEKVMTSIGNRQDAMQLLISQGFSPEMADLATRSDARAQMQRLKSQAVASDEMAKSTLAVSSALSEMESALMGAVKRIDDATGLFGALGDGIKALVPVIGGMTDIALEIVRIFGSIRDVLKQAFAPVLDKLKTFGESVDKSAKDGGNGFLDYFVGTNEAGLSDYSMDPEQKMREARGRSAVGNASGESTVGDVRDKIKDNLRKREGLRLKAYQDSGGTWTIGYGHTHGVKPGMTITQEQAEAMLEEDIRKNVDPALALYEGHSDKTKMLAADLSYNGGMRAIQKGSRFHQLAQQGDIRESDYRKIYVTANGRYLKGLENRRVETYRMADRLEAQDGGRRIFAPPMQRAVTVAPPPFVPPRKDRQVASNNVTNNQTITIYAPTTNAHDLAEEVKKKSPMMAPYASPMVA